MIKEKSKLKSMDMAKYILHNFNHALNNNLWGLWVQNQNDACQWFIPPLEVRYLKGGRDKEKDGE